MQEGQLNILIDGQFGSTGKGKIAAYLARKFNIAAAICNNASNAGHTFYVGGNKYVAFHLPAAAANENTKLYIGASAMITMSMFLQEMEDFADLHVTDRLHIHPNAVIIEPEYAEWEKAHLTRISSTTKGCGRALAMKVMRHPDVKLASEIPELKEFICADMNEQLHSIMQVGGAVLGETAQGFGLSLNHGPLYPYCTSRDVTVAQMLNDCGVAPRRLGEVYASLRCHPIRVGNVEKDGKRIGYSGPVYDDQEELDWDTITKRSGSPNPISETTTVTGKIRRVFTWSDKQVEQFIRVNDPDYIFLNFVNYLDYGVYGAGEAPVIYKKYPVILEFIQKIQQRHGIPVAYVGTGPEESHMLDFAVDAD